MIDKSVTPHEATVISPETSAAKPLDRKSEAKKSRIAGLALLIAFIALFFTAAGIAAGYKHWQRMSDRAKANARQITTLEESINAKSDQQAISELREELNTERAAQQQKMTTYLKQISEMHSQTQQFANTVNNQIEQITALQAHLNHETAATTSIIDSSSKTALQLAEVGLLLKMADQQLRLTRQPKTAAAILRVADQRLSEVSSNNYMPVRQQIARDLAALQASAAPNLAGISQRITTLINQLQSLINTPVDPLHHNTALPENTDSDDNITNTAVKTVWSGYKDKVLRTLNEAIVVRELNDAMAKTLGMNDRAQLAQLITLRLEALRLMALQRNDQAFQQQLDLLRNTAEYVPTEVTTLLATALKPLANIALNPDLPNISGSLNMLNKARHINEENAEESVQ